MSEVEPKRGDYRIVQEKGWIGTNYILQEFKRNESFETIIVYDWIDIFGSRRQATCESEVARLQFKPERFVVKTYNQKD